MHFAEFGVVMMLFLVGLELQPSAVAIARPDSGTRRLAGGYDLVVAIISFIFGLSWQMALAVGVLSFNGDRAPNSQREGANKTEGGQSSFSVLLFQDIAVIPMLAYLCWR